MASNFKGIFSFFTKYLKAPWKITGPLASPEFLESVVTAGEYRPVAPASIAVKAIIPQADPERIYNISYYTRDTKRAEVSSVKILVDPQDYGKKTSTAEGEEPEVKPLEFAADEPQKRFYVMGSLFRQDYTPNGGYQR